MSEHEWDSLFWGAGWQDLRRYWRCEKSHRQHDRHLVGWNSDMYDALLNQVYFDWNTGPSVFGLHCNEVLLRRWVFLVTACRAIYNHVTK